MIETLIKGGPMMVPLLACSIAALAVVLDRFSAFRKNAKIDTRSLRASVLRLVRDDRMDEAIQLCNSTPGPVSAVLLTGLQTFHRFRGLNESADSLRLMVGDAMSDYALHATSAVEKRLGVLSTVGNAAPLLGMTGTVLGMINSFEAMSGAAGVDSGLVAQGISEALITTATGLLIALGAVVPYQWFTSQSNAIDLEIQECITELIDLITLKVRTTTP